MSSTSTGAHFGRNEAHRAEAVGHFRGGHPASGVRSLRLGADDEAFEAFGNAGSEDAFGDG